MLDRVNRMSSSMEILEVKYKMKYTIYIKIVIVLAVASFYNLMVTMKIFPLVLGFEWSRHISNYADQYNTGAHQGIGNLSPFQVFFGRKPNLRTDFKETQDHTFDDIASEKIENFSVKTNEIRSLASSSSKSSANKMIQRNKRKFPPSEYSIGEEVIIKNVYMGKKIKSKAEKTFCGIIKDKKNDKYQIEYTKNGNLKIEWYPVSLITSTTRQIEKEKQAKKEKSRLKSLKTNTI